MSRVPSHSLFHPGTWPPLLGLTCAVAALVICVRPLVARGVADAAQSMASLDQIVARLDSYDAIARRDARADLARRGRTALPLLQKALANRSATSRMKQGAIGSLNDMNGISADDVHGATFAEILRSVGDPDPALAGEAYRFFAKYIVAGSLNVVPPAKTIDVRVKGTSVSEGDFKFIFTASGTKDTVRLALSEIQCYEDSSAGTTRWLFNVLAEGRSFVVPEQRYGDAGRPQRYPLSAMERSPSPYEQSARQYGRETDRFSLSVSSGTKLTSPLRIVGYKPKHIE